MTDPKKKTIAWPTAAVLLALIVGNVLIALLAPAADRLALMAAYSLTVGTVLAFMRGVLGSAALVLALSLTSGCGASAVQTAISAQATVLVAHHSARVEFYASEGHRCRAASPTIEAWDVCMRPAEAVQRSADSFRDTLTAAQAALDAYGADGAKAQVACAIVAAARLVEASSAAGAPVPQEAMNVAALVTEGVCHAE